jgi:hypothetical protein
VTHIDAEAKAVTMADGTTIQYGALISTIPLDRTLCWLGKPDWAEGLHHSASHIIGVGLRGNWCVGVGLRGKLVRCFGVGAAVTGDLP